MFDSQNTEALRRSELWSSQLKETLQDEFQATGYVDWLSEFPDGDTFTIPSIGDAEVDDYAEGESIKYRAMDTGEFQFSINKYKSSGTYIYDKSKQDGYYMDQLVAGFVPKQERAIMGAVESDILGLQSQQTSANLNVINGANHRFVGSGTNEIMDVKDFALARYALKKANVPDTNLIAIVDPSVEFAMNNITNITNMSNNAQWEGIVSDGISTGMRFMKNIYGFDVYVSNYLSDANETINGKTTEAGKANLFFSAAQDVLPFKGAWRQMPEVEFIRDGDKKRDKYNTTARYGVKLYRPENLVTVLTDTDQVS